MRHTASLILTKKKRRLLPFVPNQDLGRILKQMGSLAIALTSVGVEFSDELTYRPGMALGLANKDMMEKDGMQVDSHWQIQSLYSRWNQDHQTHIDYSWL